MLDDNIIELTDADVVEEYDPHPVTSTDAADQVRDDDHRKAVATAQELIRQRGILAKDLESALNIGRRYRAVLKDNVLPDPCADRLEPLLRKYGMTGKRAWAPGANPRESARVNAELSASELHQLESGDTF